MSHLPGEAPVMRPIGNAARDRLNTAGGFGFEPVRTPEFVHPSVGGRWDQDVLEIPRVADRSARNIRYTPGNLPLDAARLAALRDGQAVTVA